MDYQKKSSLQIGVSGAEKNYLKMPWSIEDTIENLEELKEMMQQKLIMTNYHGRGEKDAEEIAFSRRGNSRICENANTHLQHILCIKYCCWAAWVGNHRVERQEYR